MKYIIVVGYNQWSRVKSLLTLLTSIPDPYIHIHFVDNLGDDEIKDALTSYSRSFYHRWGNIGYGAAINKVLSSLKLEPMDQYIVSNDDVTIDQDSLIKIFEAHAELKTLIPRLGIICPTFCSTNDSDSTRYYELGSVISADYTTLLFGPAAFWAFDYDFIKQVGGFLPNIFLYGEDRELCNRSRYNGFTNVLIHSIKIQHDFQYPPKKYSHQILKERNILVALHLNLNPTMLTPFRFVATGLLYSISRFRFKRMLALSIAFFQFLRGLAIIQQVKLNHQKQIPFRYIK